MAEHPEGGMEGLAARLAPGERVAGIDLGTRTIGLALSDVERRIATPWRTIERVKFTRDAAELLAALGQERIGGLVIGLPLNMDGSEGPRAQSTRAFARNILRLGAPPIAFWDERLSTVAAERALISADLSRRKRAAVIDATAAGFILQGALDRLRRIEAAPDGSA